MTAEKAALLTAVRACQVSFAAASKDAATLAAAVRAVDVATLASTYTLIHDLRFEPLESSAPRPAAPHGVSVFSKHRAPSPIDVWGALAQRFLDAEQDA
jgi:hypothetical protein